MRRTICRAHAFLFGGAAEIGPETSEPTPGRSELQIRDAARRAETRELEAALRSANEARELGRWLEADLLWLRFKVLAAQRQWAVQGITTPQYEQVLEDVARALAQLERQLVRFSEPIADSQGEPS